MIRLFLLRSAYGALACTTVPAHAAIFSVGPAGDCTHTTLQAALNDAANNSGADVVRIVDRSWTAIQVSTNTNQALEISGGWATCSSSAPSGTTTLNGAGGQARSVISLRGNADFTLRDLVIEGGDQADDDDGGGIHFLGGGILRIVDSAITNNSADEGGGLYAHGTTITAEVILEDTLIASNTARRHGGGVVAQELEMTIRGAGSALMSNVAGGSGGGLLVRSGIRKSYAYVSGGLFGIQNNRAARGGGIAVQTGPEELDAEVQVFSVDSEVPVVIGGNIATERGGGIDVQPDYSSGINGFPGSETTARALLRHVDLRGNTAPVGAAINLAHVNHGPLGASAMGGQLNFNVEAIQDLHPSAAPCPVGRPCGYIRQNQTGNLTGAVVHMSNDTRFYGNRLVVDDNLGGWLIYIAGEDSVSLGLFNTLIVGNTVQNALIRDDQNEDSGYSNLGLSFLTITGNTIGANGVLSMNEEMVLKRSIIDQPGKRLFATDVGTSGGTYVMEQNVVTVTPLPAGAVLGSPRFVDAERGDFMPRAGSRAVDFAAPAESFTEDLHGRSRNVDIVGNPDEFGVTDAGAIERDELKPMLLNAEFDADVHLWNLAPGNWDATQDRDGDASSGAAKLIYDPSIGGGDGATPIAVNSQCIPLPGPGVYELNGHGRLSSGAPGVRARLRWELRLFGGLFGCEDGAPDLTGVHLLATGTAWTRPGISSQIVVPEAAWSVDSSLTIQLDVLGAPVGTTSAWFDGIELIKTDDPPSSNANAAGIVTTAGPLVPGFSADTSDYAVATDDASATVRVDAQVQSPAITVNGIVVSSGVSSPAIALAPGPNTVTVRITAPDAVTVKTYVLTITRSGGSSSLFADGFED